MDLEGLERLVDLLAGEGALEESQHVARARVGVLIGDAVPALDDRLARRAETHDEASTRDLGHGGDAHGEQSRPPGEGRGHRDADVEALPVSAAT